MLLGLYRTASERVREARRDHGTQRERVGILSTRVAQAWADLLEVVPSELHRGVALEGRDDRLAAVESAATVKTAVKAP